MSRWIVAAAVVFAIALLGRRASADFTHGWVFKQPPDPAAVARAADDMRKVIERRRELVDTVTVVTVDGGEDAPIRFNGKDDLAQEAFVFPGKVGANTIRTDRKPYDEVVTACLLVARDHFPADVLEIRSDGDWLGWQDGILLYTETFGRAAKNPGIREHLGFFSGGRLRGDELPPPNDRLKDPRTRPWAIVIMLCFAGLVVLLLVPTRTG